MQLSVLIITKPTISQQAYQKIAGNNFIRLADTNHVLKSNIMFPTLFHFFWLLLQTLTAFSLVVPAILCILYFVHRFIKKQPPESDELYEEKDYAIIVSVCESTNNVQVLLQSLLRLNYSNYTIYVVGKQSAIACIGLNYEKIVYLRTATTCHNSVLLHRFAIESFKRPHTHVAILDSNSLVDENYLTNLNTFFNQGYQAVKSCRSLQNNTGIGSIIQTATNLYRNFFTGEAIFSLGSSSVLSSSGMAFSVSFYKQCLKQMKINGADFSPNLQAAILQSGRQVAFASRAVVYNTTETGIYQLMKQHAQHIHDWLFGLFFNYKMAAKGLMKGDANKLLHSLLSLSLPLPTAAFIGFVCMIVNLKINQSAAWLWAGVFFLLPVYLVIAAIRTTGNYKSETEMRDSDLVFESFFPVEHKEDYRAIMQTV